MLFLASFEQSLLMLPLVLGIYLSYKILRTTDLTVDGSFVLGAGAYARCLSEGLNHSLSLMLALLLGFTAGCIVALIQRHNRVNALVASIIMLFMLYSINFQVMGRPNISLLAHDLLSHVPPAYETLMKIVILCVMALLLLFGLALLIKSRYGLLMRAFGCNPTLLKKQGKQPERYRLLTLGLSNALAALCGVMTAQVNGYADINMGFGMALTGIGAVVIGQQLLLYLRKRTHFSVTYDLLGCLLGIYLYFLVMHLLLKIHVDPINLKLFLGVVLILSLRSASFVKRKNGHA